MLSDRSNSQNRSKLQKNRQRGINLISNTITVKPNQIVLSGLLHAKNHSKSKSYSLLDKQQLKGIKYRTGVPNEAAGTYRKGSEIQWHSAKNTENQLKTCRPTHETNSQYVQINDNNMVESGRGGKACGSASMQIEQIILKSAYFKVRQKVVPRLKIELKRP